MSTDENPSNKVKIAYVNGTTNAREWEKFASQKSAPVTFEAGKKYYIEVLHKQDEGTDYIGVGWQLPNGSFERPIDGERLSPFTDIGNYNPIVSITKPTEGHNFNAPATISIEADAIDDDGLVRKVEFFQGSSKLGEDLTEPYSFTWNNVPSGNYVLTAKATED